MNNKPFFVGYLPFPAALKPVYRLVVAVLLLLGIATAMLLSSQQRASGIGQWDVATTVTLQGRLSIDPYPILHTAEGESVLLVIQGKRGAETFVTGYRDQMVAVSGFAIRRGGWHMLEIPPEDAVALSPGAAQIAIPATQVLGQRTVSGEIVDSKCFLGVMKPGSGKVHRDCAELCLLGGLPPMLVINDVDGGRYGYVMINNDGSSASREVAEQAAIPVSINGQFERRGDLLYVRLPAADQPVTPLTGQLRQDYGPSLAMEMAN